MLHLEKLFYYSILKITTKLKKELSEKVYMYQDDISKIRIKDYMRKSMKIRKITPADDRRLAKIVRINLEHYGLDIPGTAYFDPELDHLSTFYRAASGRAYFVLTDEENHVLGGAGFAAFAGRKNCAELQKLYLDPAVQGQGLGYVLLEKVQQEAKASGYQELYLETHHVLAAAIHMYEKLGYDRIAPPIGTVHSTMDTFLVKSLAEEAGLQ